MKIFSFVKFGLPLARHLDSHEFSEQKIKIVTLTFLKKKKTIGSYDSIGIYAKADRESGWLSNLIRVWFKMYFPYSTQGLKYYGLNIQTVPVIWTPFDFRPCNLKSEFLEF